MKFTASNIDFSSLSPNLSGSRMPAHASVKEGYFSKNSYFTDVISSNVKTVADRHRHAACHYKH